MNNVSTNPDHMDNMNNMNNIDKIYIENQWYNITDFIKRHPGGNVIRSYINQDATQVYHEMHYRSKRANHILHSLPKIETDHKPVVESNYNMLIDFDRWRLSLQDRGFFRPSKSHVVYRITELIGLFVFASWLMSFDSLGYRILSVLVYGVFGGRCGWVQHEAGHRSFTGVIKWDTIIQKATIGFGLLTSGPMWNSMHNKHHACTQKLEHDMDLDTMPFVLFHPSALRLNQTMSKWWLRFQAWTFLPVTSGIFVMLFWIYYLHPRKIIRDKDLLQGFFTMLGHMSRTYVIHKMTGYSYLHSYLWLMCCMYVSGVYLFGHFSTSHTFMPVVKPHENPTWVEYSLNHTVDIDTQNPIVSWIMGYLNCQCVHHLFPQMPQFRQPEVSRELAVFAKKWDLKYQHISYWDAWYLTFKNMNDVGKYMNQI